MTVDMHCHLDLYSDPISVAEQCGARGTYVLSVTTTPKAWEGTRGLAGSNRRIQTALGLHPQLAHDRAHEIELFDALLPDVKYVGEIGLDGGKAFAANRNIQLTVFRHILRSVNRAGGRIMTIHSRASAPEVLDELDGVAGVPILHWFTGSAYQLKRAIAIGCWFSVGPAMLSTKRGRELTSNIPKERVLTETDGPFTKHQGETLLPWDADIATAQLANLWKTSISEAEFILRDNLGSLSHAGELGPA